MTSSKSTDINSFQRLLDEQSSCIESTQREINQLEKFRSDYESVIQTVEDLQKSVSKPAYLPFGHKALVPGRLVHTNELLVFLGGHGEYFAKLSALETIELMKRRIEKLNSKIDGLTQQKKLLEDRVPYTKDLTTIKSLSSTDVNQTSATVDSEEFEIREEYNSDEESEWKKKHALSRQRERIKNAQLESPTLTRRKVSFDLSSIEHISNYSSDSASSVTDVDSPDPCAIRFLHTMVPSPVPRSQIADLSTMTVAEAVDLVRKSGSVMRSDPFGTIVERTPTAPTPIEASAPKTDRVSRFRAQRQAEKTP